jgi:hypothetical protein
MPISKACQPCARAKVKCDQQSPCSRCIKRQITELSQPQASPPPVITVSHGSSPPTDSDHKKIPRAVYGSVCVPCRVGKRKCDKQTPCGRCFRLNQADMCFPCALLPKNKTQHSLSSDSPEAAKQMVCELMISNEQKVLKPSQKVFLNLNLQKLP